MRQILLVAALPVLAFTAAAQEEAGQVRVKKLDAERMAAQAKVVSIRTGVIGKTVKNAPYSATEINESTQVLADGTRIHNEVQTQVYRDSEGRTRRETPDAITIWDPVAKFTYILNPKTQTAQQLPLGGGVFYFSQKGDPGTFTMKVPAPDNPDMAMAKAKAEKDMMETRVFTRIIGAPGSVAAGLPPGPPELLTKDTKEMQGTSESLGTQNIAGVTAEGTRTTSTIATGAIGNDRPLEIVNERWFSAELQMVVQSRFSDPRTGEETFRLTNLSRIEPPAYLFQVPVGYQINGPKQ